MPVIHPKERERLESDAVSKLVVTVKSDAEFHADVTAALEALERDDHVDSTPTLSFGSHDQLLETFTPETLDLLDTVRRERPTSINHAARAAGRDVSNVHDELTRLANTGVIYFVKEGRAKRPVVWFDELVIDVPIGSGHESVGAEEVAP